MRKQSEGVKQQKTLWESLSDYELYLYREERSKNTIEKYMRDLQTFFLFLKERELSKEIVMKWKEELVKTHAPASVNSMVAAVNGFLNFIGLPQYKVKPLRIQRHIFSRPERELSRNEYIRLVDAARGKGNERLSLLLQTICATGIRVSEVKYITAEALSVGRAEVDCKGKSRVIFLPKDLCRLLRKYCRENRIGSGPVFRTRSGGNFDRSNIWREMKNLCERANVDSEKVFPHNLRHLFARTYYSLEKDLSKLADLLGHTSITTTRIYTMETGEKHARQIERMGLVLCAV